MSAIQIPFSDYSKRAGSITIDQAKYLWETNEKANGKTSGAVEAIVDSTFRINSVLTPIAISSTKIHSIVSRIVGAVSINGPQARQAFRTLGTAMIGASTVVLFYLSAPFLALELRQHILRLTDPLLSNATLSMVPGFQRSVQPTIPEGIDVVPPAEKIFRLQIPAIDVDIDVEPNVDPGNPSEYEPILETRVAHARGTGFPDKDGGINKSIYIFAHSTNGSWNITRYNAQFYALKDLEYSDEIIVWYWGEEHRYKIISSEIVEPNDTSYLEPQLDRELLILQTCWPPGTTEKRYVVVAEPITT